MTAAVEPDDDGRTTRSSEVRYATNGDVEYVAFPVRWDEGGEVAAFAMEAINTRTGAFSLQVVGQPGGTDGCACSNCAPHDQEGFMPVRYWCRVWGDPIPCSAMTREGRQCLRYAADDDPEQLCSTHRAIKRRRQQRGGVTA
jgi:hypothetical protein